MRVIYDYQAFSMQSYGGVSRYVSEIVSGIRRHHRDVTPELVGRYSSENENLIDLGVRIDSRFHAYRGPGRGRLALMADALNQEMVDEALREQGRADVAHPTYYHTHPAADIAVPVVVTVHDMIHELFDTLPARRWTISRKRAAIERADRIIVPSESTMHDLIRFVAMPAERISVIPHGATFTGDEPDYPALITPERYVLYVGNRSSYKGFDIFCEALALLRADDPDLRGIVAGGGGLRSEELSMIDRLGLGGALQHLPVESRMLPAIYRRATLFIAPSLYEGFGLPVLEAMTFGTPCVVSDSSSHPEVGGDAVVYFEPNSAEDLARAAGGLLSHAGARERVSSAGRERARRFSWKASVDAHVALYRELSS